MKFQAHGSLEPLLEYNQDLALKESRSIMTFLTFLGVNRKYEAPD